MTLNSFYSENELDSLGLRSRGRNVMLSRKASIYGASRISLGSNVRIDDFCILSAGDEGISIGNYVHISAAACFFGYSEIVLGDFAAVSGRCGIYSGTDDFRGNGVPGPTVPDAIRQVDARPVHLDAHTLIGTGCTVLPGTYLGVGAVLGAMSLARAGDYEEFTIYAGVPARAIGPRNRTILEKVQGLPLD